VPEDYGRQGGDLGPRSSHLVDLSTCVNQYGYPPVVSELLSQPVPATWISHHPWNSADPLLESYAAHLSVGSNDLAPTRGSSSAIWSLAHSELASEVAVPLPAYTEYLRAFPGARIGQASVQYDLGVIDQAMHLGRTVLISNPHNPSGTLIPPADLLEIALQNPDGRLIVDESYCDFVATPSAQISIAGMLADNVATLHSASKFYGIPGARAGVAWSRNRALLEALAPRENWPVSRFDVEIVISALAASAWAVATRARIDRDLRWTTRAASGNLAADPAANFVLIRLPTGFNAERQAREAGFALRPLGEPHGLPRAHARLSVPRPEHRPNVKAFFEQLTAFAPR